MFPCWPDSKRPAFPKNENGPSLWQSFATADPITLAEKWFENPRDGQYGPIEMGGMFTIVKIREGLDRNDYKDPGWFKHPAGSVAREWTGELAKAAEAPTAQTNPGDVELRVVKPTGPMNH